MSTKIKDPEKRKKLWEIGIWMTILLLTPIAMILLGKSMNKEEIERKSETSLMEVSKDRPTPALEKPNSYSTFNPKYGPYEELVAYYQEALQMEANKGSAVKMAIEDAMLDNTVSIIEFENIQHLYSKAKSDEALESLLSKAEQNTAGVQIESLEKFNEGDFVYEYNEFMDGMIAHVKKTINSLFN